MGIVNDGGCERVGFGVVDHAQIDRQQTPTIDLGVASVAGARLSSAPAQLCQKRECGSLELS